MPASTNSAHHQLRDSLIATIKQEQHRLKTDYPQTWSYLKQFNPQLTQVDFAVLSPEVSAQQNLNQEFKPDQARVSIEVTGEEHAQILQKLATLAQAPAGQAELPDQLYFEQQLSDMMGLTVTAELENYRLPYTIAHAQALPHYPTHPNDQLSAHQLEEAGLSQSRSTFGWLTDKDKTYQHEAFGVAIPLHKLPDWSTRRSEYLAWFKYRKVVLINPARQKAAVGLITQVGPAHVQRFQVGLSPELIRATQAWHPDSKGKMIILLLDEAGGKSKLGPVPLCQLLTGETK
ncbi:MAG: hypothetical protein ABIJ03_00745 [Patescibacteria group bacterium]|nr:hypothetical protein [Patescibacteria group bacterium]